jgi:DNA-directed RNA polymerase subunit H (RpoH/RPB5)
MRALPRKYLIQRRQFFSHACETQNAMLTAPTRRTRAVKITTLGLLSLLLAGCTTLPTINGTDPIPANRLFALQTETPGAAAVTIIRDSSFAGSAIRYRVLIDGMLAAMIWTGERATFYVQPGEHVIEVQHPDSGLGAIGDSDAVQAVASGRYFYRVNSDLGMIKLLRTTVVSATAERVVVPPKTPQIHGP